MGNHQSKVEQEVIINFNAADEEASIYSADPVWMRKLDKLAEQSPDLYRVHRQETYEGKIVAKEYLFTKKLITLRSKVRVSSMTDEQKHEAADRLRRNKINSKR